LVESVVLNGVTWKHSRGYVPMIATAQRFAELNPGVRIEWHLRSLQDFADVSIAALSQKYDLLVIDHPSMGEAEAHGLFVPLEQHMSTTFLGNQACSSVGASHCSYNVGGHQLALAIDAATPVAAARLDVLARRGYTVPDTWDDLIELARAGLVALAGLKLDCLMYWYALCINEGQAPFSESDSLVASETGYRALIALKELTDACGTDCLSRDPIATYELLTTSDEYGYSPMAYGYSNYARSSYTKNPLWFGGLVQRNGRVLTSTLGGAGLAVSTQCKHLSKALDYTQFVANAEIQRGLYTASGGQPGHRDAWTDAENNRTSNNFFLNTLATHDTAYVRPRYAGYIDFQERAPDVIASYLAGGIDAATALSDLAQLDRQYRAGQVNLQPEVATRTTV
jgi:multiple sugar transport system substrate-binding protein